MAKKQRSTASEYEQLTTAVAPLLKRPRQRGRARRLHDLPTREFETVAARSGFPEESIRLLAAAERESATTGLPADALFAWYRAGLAQPSAAAGVVVRRPEELIAALRDAADAGVVPRTTEAARKKLEARLENLRIDATLKPAGPGARASLGDLLDAEDPRWLAASQRRAVALAADTFSHRSPEFEAALRDAGIEAADVARIQRTMALGELTRGHAPAVGALAAILRDGSDDLSLGRLTRLRDDDWLDIAYASGPPPDAPFSPEEYGDAMAAAVEEAVPAAALRNVIAAGRLSVDRSGFAAIPDFLEKNPSFDFGRDDVDAFVAKANLSGIDEEPAAVAGALRQLQAVKRLGARWTEASALLEEGLGSIDDIADFGPERLKRRLAGRMPERRIEEIAGTALAARSVGIGLIGAFMPIMQLPAAVDQSPTLRKLFGPLERCACEPSRSVLSPAAYLVDLLRLVENDRAALFTLESRRPDVLDLELSCENTQIELPYVDLVNETLENAIALPYRIELAATADIRAELAKSPLTGAVRAALQRTAVEPLGPLSAVPDTWSEQPKIFKPQASYWVVTDRCRRWVLEASDTYFGIAPGFVKSGMALDAISLTALIQGMDNGAVPPDAKARFDALLAAQIPGTLPASITRVSITPLEPGKRWKVTYCANGLVSIDEANATVTLSEVEGPPVVSKRYSRAGIDATRNALESKVLGGLLKVASGGSFGGYAVKKVPGGWTYSQARTVEIVFRAAGLTIKSLTYQSTAADRDLQTRPQHRNPIAYDDHLEKAVYPWDAPFSLNLAETRALLARSPRSRVDLIAAATPRARQYTEIVLARERIRLSEAEWTLITSGATLPDLWARWGLTVSGNSATIRDSFNDTVATDAPLNLLERVSILMQQGQLTFAQLDELLQSEYINPGRSAKITPLEGCNLSELRVENLSASHLDRMARFIRLQRHLGWTARDLDVAMRLLSNAGPTATAVRDLVYLKEAASALGVSVELAATWIGGFDRQTFTFGANQIEPLYERVFQDRRLAETLNPDLAWSSVAAAGSTMAAQTTAIAAAFGVRPEQLLPLLQLETPAVADFAAAPLDPGNLLTVFRHATLSRALALPVDRYIELTRLLNASPFASVAGLLDYREDAVRMKAAGFDPAVLAYILNDVQETGANWILVPADARGLMTGLQTALREAAQADSTAGAAAAAAADPITAFSADETSCLQTAPATAADRWQRWALTLDANGNATWVDPANPAPAITGAPMAMLGRAAVLASQAGLSIDQLSDVLQATFIDPARPPALVVSSTVPQMVSNLTPAHLDRLERFLILQRATGWSVYDLDLAIRALGVPTMPADPLTIDLVALTDRLRWIAALRTRFDLPIDTIVSWWGGLAAPLYTTRVGGAPAPIAGVFERLFPATPPYADFALDASRTQLQIEQAPPASPPTLASKAALLARSFGVDEPAVADALRYGGLPDGNLTLSNLSRLHRLMLLSKGLGIPVRTLRRIQTSLGTNPFQGPQQALEFAVAATTWNRRADLVVGRIAEAFSLDRQAVADLLWERLTGTPNSPSRAIELFADPSVKFEDAVIALDGIDTTAEYAVLAKTHKIALLSSTWRLSPGELGWATSLLPVEDLATAPTTSRFAAWRQLAFLVALGRTSGSMPAAIDQYLSAVRTAAAAGGNPIVEGAKVLGRVLRLPDTEIQALAAADLLDIAAADAGLPSRIAEWVGLAVILKKLAIAATDLKLLVAAVPTPAAVEAARAILRAGYTQDGWRTALREAMNEVREQQRGHLVEYLVARDGVRDSEALFERYLIDVNMAPCMTTTRLLQSVAAVQLFVQRCLMNLEPTVSAGDIDPDRRWEWMKNYRVWEANRKVFLYPENWIFPELRDDKSETFRAFESALTQNEPTTENAVRAAREYLDALLDVGQISVMAMYEHIEDLSTSAAKKYRRTLYVVGRSPDPPYVFYWRRALRFGEPGMRWTPWERIDLDLSGDHIVPFVFEGDFHVVWPVVKQVRDGDNDYYDVQLAWGRHTTIGWTKRKASRESAVRIQKYFNRDVRTMLALNITDHTMDPEQVGIGLYVARKTADVVSASSISPTNTASQAITGYASYLYQQWKLTVKARAYVRFTTTARIANVSSCSVSIRGRRPDSFYPNDPSFKESGVYDGPTAERAGPYPIDQIPTLTIRGDAGQAFEATAVIGGQTLTAETPVLMAEDTAVQWKDEVEITVNFLFETAVDPEFNDPYEPVTMELQGKFLFDTGRETRWVAMTGSPAPPLSYPAGTLPWGGGLMERAPSTNGLPGVFGNSRDGARFLAVKSWRAPVAFPGSPEETWYWEEKGDQNDARFFLREKVVANGSEILAIHPSAYSEAGRYKARFAAASDALYSVPTQEAPLNPRFGVDALQSYVPAKVAGGKDPRDRALIAFDLAYPYASYNWEVFFHIPLTAARFFSAQQRFRDAEAWLRYIFDPTTNDPSPGRERYWRFLPFRHANQPETIEELMTAFANPEGDSDLKARMLEQIDAWIDDPFNPFAVARLRPSAFEWRAVVLWISNLIAEGDSLFRRDTRESIQEATLLYVLAAKILGPRPVKVPARGVMQMPQSYRALGGRWDEFANAWARLIDTPLGQAMLQMLLSFAKIGGINPHAFDVQIDQLKSVASLYFCIPRNEAVDQLWNTVEDRLFNVRHCRTIDGIARELPLFETPIDPELLVRARAAGVDLADVLNDRYAPAPRYRFTAMLQRAMEVCGEARSLGAAVLAAVEKKDAETLALLRSTQEIEMLGLIRQVKQEAVKEVDAAIEALRASRAAVIDRLTYLQRLLGENSVAVDAAGVPIVSQALSLQPRPGGAPGDFRNLALIQSEIDQIARMQEAHVWSVVGGVLKAASGLSHAAAGVAVATPDPSEKAAKILTAVAHGLSALGDGASTIATNASGWERRAGMIAGFQRRREEWVQQSRLAVAEIRQIDKQIAAVEIRKAIAENEVANQTRSIEHVEAVDEYLRRQKFTSAALYSWMEGRLSELHSAVYQLAFSLAKRAERALRLELGQPSVSFLGFGYWESARKGMLAGDRLAADLRRMEAAYLDQSQREYELTKHISLWALDPAALITLRQTGRCEVAVPEALFDLDCPGHYFRRIKSAALSIPSVTGPYTSVNCTFTLLKSTVRHNQAISSGYERDTAGDDSRFTDTFGSIQSVVTSTAQNDTGLFETNLRDERFLPFEGAGAISTWRIELPNVFRQFDYDTIADVILHIRYTARDGGESLRQAAVSGMNVALNAIARETGGPGLARAFSLRQEFPTELQRFRNPAGTGTTNRITLTLGVERFPYLLHGRNFRLDAFDFYVALNPDAPPNAALDDSNLRITFEPGTMGSTDDADALALSEWNSLLAGTREAPGGKPGAWTLTAWRYDSGTAERIDPDAIEDIVVMCRIGL